MKIEELLKGKPLEQSKDFMASLSYEWKELTVDYIINRFYKGNKNAGKFIKVLIDNNLVLKRGGIVAGKTILNRYGKQVPVRGANSYRLAEPPIEEDEFFSQVEDHKPSTIEDCWLNWNPKGKHTLPVEEDKDYGESGPIPGIIESFDI